MNGRAWLAHELTSLVEMKEVRRLGWTRIALALDRTAQACQVRYSGIVVTRLRGHGSSPRRVRRRRREIVEDRACDVVPANAAPNIIVPSPVSNTSARVIPTSRLVVDADLRSRIAAQGITAGLCGDPLPGRSALDRKLAGEDA